MKIKVERRNPKTGRIIEGPLTHESTMDLNCQKMCAFHEEIGDKTVGVSIEGGNVVVRIWDKEYSKDEVLVITQTLDVE